MKMEKRNLPIGASTVTNIKVGADGNYVDGLGRETQFNVDEYGDDMGRFKNAHAP
jgi:hypothetical protein